MSSVKQFQIINFGYIQSIYHLSLCRILIILYSILWNTITHIKKHIKMHFFTTCIFLFIQNGSWKMSTLSMHRFICHSIHFIWRFWPCVIFGVFHFMLSDLQMPTFAWTCEQQQTWAPLSQANNFFSFERLLWEHLHGNIWEWQEIRHFSAWRAMNVFQVLQRDEQSIQPRNLQTSDRIYGVRQQVVLITHVIFQTNCCTGLTAGVLEWCLSPGIITVILCFHNTSTTLFLLTIHLVWCDLNEGDRGGFSYH